MVSIPTSLLSPSARPLPPEGVARLAELGLKREQLPRHVAMIMDGNGRWARNRGFPRFLGHRQGIKSVRAMVEEGCHLGLDQLTLYCFSIENWKRPNREVQYLMKLLNRFVIIEREALHRQNVRLTMIGRREGLPPAVLAEIDKTIELTRDNDGLTLCLAINYGGRTEIIDAVRGLARDAQAGLIEPDTIDEEVFANRLLTKGMPDPDLLIRTAGEMRVSNFLLWQISYAEIWVTETLWPDFRANEFGQALMSYARRQRKFGGLPQSESGQ